jgi:alginate O-acetyltransferase complex protein AlgI
MLFNSFIFVGLVSITFFLYYLPKLYKYQLQILILSSLIFYSYYRPILVLLLIFSVTINIISSYYVVYGKLKYKKMFAVLGVGLNLLVLCFFKYSPLFARTFFNESGSIGEFLITIPLPIGISFFTFQGISLVIDVFKEKVVSGKEVIPRSFILHAKRIMLFKAFFPQLISGPIVKAHEFLPQIETKKLIDINWEVCLKNLILGYFLKMVVADNLKDFTYWMTYPYFESQKTLSLIVMLFGYSCQIFADFAGYSLIAIGLARLFGYYFKDNFNFPYISVSFKEFWKRWHISLSTFLMQYLYIPLGGNKKGKVRTYINLMITMLLGGLWHGAAWSYMVWGGFHGLLLAIERFFSDKFTIKEGAIIRFFKGLLVVGLVTLGWLLFKLPEFNYVLKYLSTIFTNTGLGRIDITFYILLYTIPIIIYHSLYLMKKKEGYQRIKKFEYIIYGFMIFMILTNSGSPGAFIYFQF